MHYFLLPPGIFVVLFAYATYIIKSKVRYIFGVFTILTYLFSTQIFYDTLFKNTLQQTISTESNETFDAVVVLGLGVNENSPSFELPPESFKNFMYGVYLSSTHNVPLLFSGKGLAELSESEALKNSVQKLSSICKIPTIHYESESLNTFENAKYTYKLLSKMDLENKNIALVTSSWHIQRASDAFEQNGLKIIKKPSKFEENKREDTTTYNLFSFLPSMEYMVKTHIKIKEILGQIALRIKG